MTAEQQRLDKAAELSDMTHELLRAGIRRRFPGASESEVQRVYLERLEPVSQTDLLIEVTRALEEAGVGYLLTGSFASARPAARGAQGHHTTSIWSSRSICSAVDALSKSFGAPAYYFDAEGARSALSEHSMFNLRPMTSSGDKVGLLGVDRRSLSTSAGSAARICVEVIRPRPVCVSAPEDTSCRSQVAPSASREHASVSSTSRHVWRGRRALATSLSASTTVLAVG